MNATSTRAPRGLWLAVAALVAVGVLAGCDTTPQLLRGTVTTINGSIPVGVEVALYTDEATQVAVTTTDATGAYTFRASSGLSEGDYQLRVGEQWWPEGYSWDQAGNVTVTTGATATYDLVLVEPAATFAGAVVDAADDPVSGALVGAYRPDTGSFVAVTTTGADGTFRIDVVEAGPHVVHLVHPDHPPMTAGGDPAAVVHLGAGSTDIGTIDLTTGAITPPAYKAVASGSSHNCAIASDDTLTCWGHDYAGKATPPTGTYKAVTAGGAHSCAIATDDTLTCWGDDSEGQASPPLGEYKTVTAGAGSDHTCAIATDDTISCWGRNGDGQATPPTGTYTSVAAGSDHSCAVATDGTITCWGWNVGVIITPPPGTYRTVTASGYHTCAIATDDTITCWGEDEYGQASAPSGAYDTVTAGYFHSCAIATDQTLACWGADAFGMLSPPAGTYEAVSAGAGHACALATDDTITCWGDNLSGEATPPAGG